MLVKIQLEQLLQLQVALLVVIEFAIHPLAIAVEHKRLAALVLQMLEHVQFYVLTDALAVQAAFVKQVLHAHCLLVLVVNYRLSQRFIVC